MVFRHETDNTEAVRALREKDVSFNRVAGKQ
jgi:hypothetical protein